MKNQKPMNKTALAITLIALAVFMTLSTTPLVSAQTDATGLGGLWAWMTGLGIGAIFIGLIAFAIWRGWIFEASSDSVKTVSAVVAAVFIFAGAIGLGLFATTATTITPPGGPINWASTVSETMDSVVPIAGSNSLEVRTHFNTTSGAYANNTEFVLLNFTISRSDTSTAAAFTSVEVTNVGSFTAVTGANAGTTRDGIALGADGNFEADWRKGSGNAGDVGPFIMDTDFPRESTHRDGYANVNITLSASAGALMTVVGNSYTITLDVAGDTYTLIVRATSVYA